MRVVVKGERLLRAVQVLAGVQRHGVVRCIVGHISTGMQRAVMSDRAGR